MEWLIYLLGAAVLLVPIFIYTKGRTVVKGRHDNQKTRDDITDSMGSHR